MLEFDRPATETIRSLNDQFRRSFVGGCVLLTEGVAGLDQDRRARLLSAIREFDEFGLANDPYEEHDFGTVEESGDRFFWKIEYYDRALESGSPDPSDPALTTRTLTVMFTAEY